MKKTVLKRALSILLTVCMALSLAPAGAFSVQLPQAGETVAGYVSDDNGYIKYFVDVAGGGFYILPSNQPFDGTKAPSFGSFTLDGKEYVYGGDYPDSGFTLPPYIADNGMCQSEWRIGGVYITQCLNIIKNDAGSDSYAVYIRYEASGSSALSPEYAENPAGIGVPFSGRILLDTLLGPDDDMPVTVSNSSVFITNETAFAGDNMPEYYNLDPTFTGISPRAYGLIVHETVTSPSALIFARFDNVSSTVYGYTPDGGVNFTDGGGADSAALLYFDGQSDYPGAPVYFSTIYGFDDLTYAAAATALDSELGPPPVVTTTAQIQAGLPEIVTGVDSETPTVVGFGGMLWSVVGYNSRGVVSDAGTLTLLSTEPLGENTRYVTDWANPSTIFFENTIMKARLDNAYASLPEKEAKLVVKHEVTTITDVTKITDYFEFVGGFHETFSMGYWSPTYDDVKDVKSAVLFFPSDWWTDVFYIEFPTNFIDLANYIYGMTKVLADGTGTGYDNTLEEECAIRPAVILNLADVVFTSATAGGKPATASYAMMEAETLTASDAVKFTILDDENLKLGSITNAEVIAHKMISFDYTGATAGKSLSAAIFDETGKLRYYGRLADNIATSGTVEMEIPEDIVQTDRISIFVEEINAGNQTDFCSAMIDIQFDFIIRYVEIGAGSGYSPSLDGLIFAFDMPSAFILERRDTAKALQRIFLTDKNGEVPFEAQLLENGDTQVSFNWQFSDVDYAHVTTAARKITAPESNSLGFAFVDLSVGAQSGYVFPTDAAAVENTIRLQLTADIGTFPSETITIVDSTGNTPLMEVDYKDFSGDTEGIRVYNYEFVMPDNDITFLVETTQTEVSEYSVFSNAPEGCGQITLWNVTDDEPVAGGLAEPGKLIRVTVSGIDYEHNDFHGLTVTNSMSGREVALDTVVSGTEYLFTMPKYSVNVNLDVRAKPVYYVRSQMPDVNGAAMELTNGRTGAFGKVSLAGYNGDTVTFVLTNKNIKKIITSVEILRPSADGGYEAVMTFPAADPYAESLTGSFTLPDADVVVSATLNDAPAVPIEVNSDLPSGTAITVTNPSSGSVLLGDAVAFTLTTPDGRYLTYRPVISVYDASGSLIYEHLFENGKKHTADVPVSYTSGAIVKSGGVPAKIVLDVRSRALSYSKELHSIIPNSNVAQLLTSIDVMGLNMYEQDAGTVYFGTSPNPTEDAASYITAYSEKKLTIKVPEHLLPQSEETVTYYVKINGVEKSCTVSFDSRIRPAPFGWLAIVSDSKNNHTVVMADSEADLMTKKGSGKIIMRLNGDVRYDYQNDLYEFTDTRAVFINNTATFDAAPGKPLRVRVTGSGVEVFASGGKMSVPGYTFVNGEDIKATLKNGVQYSDEWAKDSDGNWKKSGVENIVFVYDTLHINATVPVISDGLKVEIRSAILLKSSVVFGGKLSVKITLIDLEKLKEGKVKLGEDSFSIDIKRLEFGNHNGTFSFEGVEAVGEINLDSFAIPGFDLSEPSGKLSVNTFTNQYAIEASVDIKICSIDGELTLEPLNNGWPMIDSFKAVIGSQPGITIIPIAPIGYITKGGVGFSGVVDSLNGNFNAIPPVLVSVYGAFDFVKLLKMDDIRINVGPSEISFSAKPKIAGVDVFEKFGGGIFLTSNGIRFSIDTEAVLLKQFDVIRGSGKIEISYLNNKFSFSGSLSARVQLPKIPVSGFWYPAHVSWRGIDWAWQEISIGPYTFASINTSLNEAGAMARVSLLGYNVKVEYKWGSSSVSIGTMSAGLTNNSLETKQVLYDENGDYAGTATFGGNLKLVTASGQSPVFVQPFALLAAGATPTISVKPLSEEDIAMIEADANNTGNPLPDNWDKLDYRHHTVVFPVGIETAPDDYALIISNPSAEIKITAPDGNPFILKYANGDLNAAGLNAVLFSDTNGSESIMIRLPKNAGSWTLESEDFFGSAIIAVTPLPQLGSVKLADGKDIEWTAKNLASGETYALEIRMSADNIAASGNADPGILIDDITVVPSADGTASGTYTVTADKMDALASGLYYPAVTLVSVLSGTTDGDGNAIEKLPVSTKGAGSAYSHTNANQPGAVSSVAASPIGGGAISAVWQPVAGADGYVVSVFYADGTPVYAESALYDEAGAVVGTELVQVMYDIPAGEGAAPPEYEAALGGLTAGQEYYVEVAAYANVEFTGSAGGDNPGTVKLYGGSAASNAASIPVPRFPVIYADLPGQEPVYLDNGVRALYVNSSFNFALTADQDCEFTVVQDGEVISTLSSGGNVFVDMDGLSVSSVTITAVNAAGDTSVMSFTVYMDDVPPPLFVTTDEDGNIYSNTVGDYVITGRSEPFAVISDDLGSMEIAGEDGGFTLTGALSGADTPRSIRATDNAGNTAVADVVIKSFTGTAESLSAISITPSGTVTLELGDSFPISTAGTLVGGGAIVVPPNAVSYNITGGADSITIDSETGRVTAIAEGEAVVHVTVATADGTLKSGSLTVLVYAEEPPIILYNVTVSGQGAGASGGGRYAAGETVAISAGAAPSGMRFKNWTSDSGVVFDDANSANTAFVMTAREVTVTANFENIPPAMGPGSTPSSGGSEEDKPSGEAPLGAVNGGEASLTQNQDGSVTLDISAEDLAAYPLSGDTFTVEITGQVDVTVSFPITAVLDTGAAAVQVITTGGTVTLTRTMLEAYRAAHGDTFEIRITEGSFVVELLKNGAVISYDDPAHPLIVSIPVEPAADTNTNGYVAVTKGVSGERAIPYSVYKNGAVSFLTAATGAFDVVYNGRVFADVNMHWAASNITFVAARGIFGGVGGDAFSPDTQMTRAMFAQVLANIEGADLSGYTASRFDDVAEGAWYLPAVEWAAEKGIVGGYGGGQFGPDDNISREQMAVMLANYIQYKGFVLPAGQTAAFNDEADIAAWALDAVKAVQSAGIVGGKPGNLYDPKGEATRAEVATIFANLVRIYVGDAVTAPVSAD